jgi:hypothetical protein
MLFRRIAAVVGLLGMVLFGLASTAASATTTHHRHHHTHGVERFLGLQTDPSDTASPTIVASGPIHATGSDTVIDDTHDTFVFPDGSINVTHTPKHTRDFSDPVTCLFREHESGSYRITGGTGAYADVSGHGHYTADVTAVGCDQNAPPAVFMLVIRAHGPIRF